jgi:formate-dependent nitrite reductase membrane component NrfD
VPANQPNQPNEKGGSRDPQWAADLAHKPDPNRVPDLQIPQPLAPREPRRSPEPRTPTGQTAARIPARPSPQQRQPQETGPSYYDVPMLKAPVWKWEIAGYFFLGGLSAGAYVLGRMAERFGGREYRDLSRAAAKVAVAAAVPCAPLLIKDLGDPKRFHHMLRVWKPSTPMNLGTWTVTAFNGAAALNLLREWALNRPPSERTTLDRIADWVRRTDAPIVAVTDLAGVPLGLLMAGYTGVLLSNTSTPLWSMNPWLGALFSASAVSTGAAATSLALSLGGDSPDSPSHKALDQIDTAAHLAEAITLAGYLHRAGPLARPLTRGGLRRHLWLGGAGVVVGEALKYLPFRGRLGRWAKVSSAVAALASGFWLRWAVIYGGRESAADPTAARQASRQTGESRGNPPAGRPPNPAR